jgi:hypothetical protein
VVECVLGGDALPGARGILATWISNNDLVDRFKEGEHVVD